jgi:hypothetical protein
MLVNKESEFRGIRHSLHANSKTSQSVHDHFHSNVLITLPSHSYSSGVKSDANEPTRQPHTKTENKTSNEEWRLLGCYAVWLL